MLKGEATADFKSKDRKLSITGRGKMQKIIIDHLGAIEHMELELKNFHLLIGEQGTGKSTVAKGIYYIRNIKTRILDYLCHLYDAGQYKEHISKKAFYKELDGELTQNFISLFGYSKNLNENLYMKYWFTEDIWIEVTLTGKQQYIIKYSPILVREITDLERDVLELYKQKDNDSAAFTTLASASRERSRIYDLITGKVNTVFEDDKETYYIPAGRSMLTLLSNSRSVMRNEEDNVNLDLITKRFMLQIDSLAGAFADGIAGVHKRYPGSEQNVDVEKISEKLIKCLKGDFLFENGREYFVINKENRIPINFASSGQQEVLWLLNQLYILLLKRESAFVIIEEPEAHLYPLVQKEVIEFISYFMNMTNSTVFITTHSPYVLTCVNALYCAGKKIEESPEYKKEVDKILGENKAIMPKEISAYKIDCKGEFVDLIDPEMQEIDTELIDEVSDKINQNYLDLLWLKSEHEDNADE
jgi:hypothetical protein